MTTHLEEGLFLNFSVVTMLRAISSLLGPVPEGTPREVWDLLLGGGGGGGGQGGGQGGVGEFGLGISHWKQRFFFQLILPPKIKKIATTAQLLRQTWFAWKFCGNINCSPTHHAVMVFLRKSSTPDAVSLFWGSNISSNPIRDLVLSDTRPSLNNKKWEKYLIYPRQCL